MVSEGNSLTKHNSIHPFDLLTHFNSRSKETVLPTLISGLLLYFERSLGMSVLLDPHSLVSSLAVPGNNLLYRFERGQYADARRRYITGQHVVIGKEKTMGEVYGAEHLLRMLGTLSIFQLVSEDIFSFGPLCSVNFPSMIAQTSLDPESVAILREYIIELMKYV